MEQTKTSENEESEPPGKKKKIILGATEKVFIEGKKFRAKVDTGADKSSICIRLLRKIKFYEERGIIKIRSAHGRRMRRKIILRISLKGRWIKAYFTIADRKKMKYDILIGKNILKKGFLVDVTK